MPSWPPVKFLNHAESITILFKIYVSFFFLIFKRSMFILYKLNGLGLISRHEKICKMFTNQISEILNVHKYFVKQYVIWKNLIPIFILKCHIYTNKCKYITIIKSIYKQCPQFHGFSNVYSSVKVWSICFVSIG